MPHASKLSKAPGPARASSPQPVASKPKLAIAGGAALRARPFPARRTMGGREKRAVAQVMESDCLSGFFGSPGPEFLGGPKVRAFEEAWAEKFAYRHAVTVNSWTSGLVAAVGALGLGPGDEVICPPYTMSATATAILMWGGIPVFADIDPARFCLDPASVAARITPRTRAIMVVHLFGCPADMGAILALAKAHDLRVIEDAAQAPGALYRGKPVGALGDIGGFSLNYHKHIHTGEGGVIVCDDDNLARRCQLIRNHGENLVTDWDIEDIVNLVGGNYRLTELQAAIGIEQLKRLDGLLARRRLLARHLDSRLAGLPAIEVPPVPPECSHAYYVYPILYDARVTGVAREDFIAAVNAELPAIVTSDDVPLSGGYVEPLYLTPLFQRRVAFGSGHYPFSLAVPGPDYAKGLCPVTESMFEHRLMLSSIVREPCDSGDMDDFADAIEKVLANLGELRAGTS